MKVLVIGSGGREHALVKALYHSPSVSEVHAVPGSAGMSKEAVCHSSVDWFSENFIPFCLSHQFDLVVIGPEAPLAAGLADALRQAGLAVVGPGQQGAQLEASKEFAKQFMIEAGVPTAKSYTVSSVLEVEQRSSSFSPPYVLKADGLAAGKGVYICQTQAELIEAATKLFDEKLLGDAGTTALMEQYLDGYELSYIVLTNGKNWQALPLAQDHKRRDDGDRGPNTGGMGAVAPIAIDQSLQEKIEKQILEPVMAEMQRRQWDYRGILYVGLMVQDSEPYVLEFNVRLGDPEAQVLLPLLDGDWGQVWTSLAAGKVQPLLWKPLYTACVVMAAPGYPDAPQKGLVLQGDPMSATPCSYFIHAGLEKKENKEWVTAGGRVLNAIGMGADLQEALGHSYEQMRKVSWQDMHYRLDIGGKQLAKL